MQASIEIALKYMLYNTNALTVVYINIDPRQ